VVCDEVFSANGGFDGGVRIVSVAPSLLGGPCGIRTFGLASATFLFPIPFSFSLLFDFHVRPFKFSK